VPRQDPNLRLAHRVLGIVASMALPWTRVRIMCPDELIDDRRLTELADEATARPRAAVH